MILRCIDETGSRQTLEVGFVYTGEIKGKYCIIHFSENYKKRKKIPDKAGTRRYNKNRFVVLKK